MLGRSDAYVRRPAAPSDQPDGRLGEQRFLAVVIALPPPVVAPSQLSAAPFPGINRQKLPCGAGKNGV